MNGNDARNAKYKTYINRIIDNSYSEMREFQQYINDVALSTQYQYLTLINNFLIKTGKPPRELTLSDFASDLASYKYKEDGEEMTSGAQLTRHFALKRFSEFLYTYGYIAEDYMQKVKKPKRTESEKTMTKREHGVLSSNEVRTLMDNLRTEIENADGENKDMAKRNLAMFYLFLTTGIRQNALIALDLDDIDLDHKILRVTDKGRKSRTYDLSDGCVNALSDWLEARKKPEYNEMETDAVFVIHRFDHAFSHSYSVGFVRIEPWDLDLLVKEKTAFTGRKLSPHKLRATYGTQLYNKTKDIYFVQSCMGHASPTTTERYIRGIRNNTKKASNIMNDIMN